MGRREGQQAEGGRDLLTRAVVPLAAAGVRRLQTDWTELRQTDWTDWAEGLREGRQEGRRLAEGPAACPGPPQWQQTRQTPGLEMTLPAGPREAQQRAVGPGEAQQRAVGPGERQQLVEGSGERQQLVEGPEGHQAAAELQGPYSFLVLVQRLSRGHRQGIQIESHRPPWSRRWTSALLAPPAAPACERQGRQGASTANEARGGENTRTECLSPSRGSKNRQVW